MWDPGSDFVDVMDGTEPVTLLRRGSDPGGSGTAIAHALRCAVTTGEMLAYNRSGTRKQVASDGQCASSDAAWHLPVNELAVAPRLGDVILDGDGRRWTILVVKRATLATRWRCIARDIVLAYGLNDTVTVLKAVYAKSACGAAEATWQTWITGIRARIQPAGTTLEIADHAMQAGRQVQMLVAEDLAIDQTHRILGPDGTVYRITAALGEQRIGELQILQAEIVS